MLQSERRHVNKSTAREDATMSLNPLKRWMSGGGCLGATWFRSGTGAIGLTN